MIPQAPQAPQARIYILAESEKALSRHQVSEGITMKRLIEKKGTDSFDVIVVGGGITGAAVAYDAASRGFTVALIEKNDFGWATSAATSKLIHGGLRYLNNLEFGLVRESLNERKIMENIAPNLVNPFPFMFPNYNNLKSNKWLIRAGMILYDMLSFDKGWTRDKAKKVPCHRWLSKKEVAGMEPGVRSEGMTGGVVYYDCQSIFPERLTLGFVKSAVRHGAEVSNYTEAVDFIREDGKVTGITAKDLLTGKSKKLKGRVVVNCGGPWADIVLNTANCCDGKHQIKRSEGIHFIVKKVTEKHAVVLMTPKGRHFFVVPWRGHSLVGTTDRDYEGSPDKYRVSRESVEGLLNDLNDSYGSGDLKYSDIVFAYGGLRPLVDDQTEGSYESSRKYEIYDNADDGLDGMITVEGGKYTTSRKLAESVVNMIEKKFAAVPKKTVTAELYLAGSEIRDLDLFYKEMFAKWAPVFGEATVKFISENYGSDADAVFQIAAADKKSAVPFNEEGEIPAEIVYSIRNEMAVKLTDILFRRTGLGGLGHPGKKVLEAVASIAAKELKWDAKRKTAELAEAEKALAVPK
jgi:glycerol-3-phosphate dehydrogenase